MNSYTYIRINPGPDLRTPVMLAFSPRRLILLGANELSQLIAVCQTDFFCPPLDRFSSFAADATAISYSHGFTMSAAARRSREHVIPAQPLLVPR